MKVTINRVLCIVRRLAQIIQTKGNGDKVLADNGQYIEVGSDNEIDPIFVEWKNGESIVAGLNATNTGTDSIVLGPTTVNTGNNSVVIGNSTTSQGDNNTFVGSNNISGTNGSNNVLIGVDNTMLGFDNIVIGRNKSILNQAQTKSISIGTPESASLYPYGVSIGYDVENISFGVAIGYKSSNNGSANNYSVSIGQYSSCIRTQSVAVGSYARNSADNTTSIGASSSATTPYSVAIGYGSRMENISEAYIVSIGTAENLRKIKFLNDGIDDTDAINVRQLTNTLYGNPVYFGANTLPGETDSVTIGANASSNTTRRNVAIGAKSNTSENGTSIGFETNAVNNATAIGIYSKSTGASGISVGYSAQASGAGSLAIGTTSRASGIGSYAIGESSKSSERLSICIGAASVASQVDSIAIGSYAISNFANSVALGNRSTTGAPYTVSVGTYSIGSSNDFKRRIVGLDSGTSNYEAVNVLQLNQQLNITRLGIDNYVERTFNDGLFEQIDLYNDGKLIIDLTMTGSILSIGLLSNTDRNNAALWVETTTGQDNANQDFVKSFRTINLVADTTFNIGNNDFSTTPIYKFEFEIYIDGNLYDVSLFTNVTETAPLNVQSLIRSRVSIRRVI